MTMCQPRVAMRAAIRCITSFGVESTSRLMKLKRTPFTPALSRALSSASVISSPTKATPLALPLECPSASTSARLSVSWQVACTMTFLSKPRKSRSANSFSFGASQGVYLRFGANGNTASGPKTWQCESTAPAGGLNFGFDGLGWNGMYPGLIGTQTSPSRLNSLHCQRHALADADAHGGKRALATALFEAVYRSECQPRAGHAERMTERNSAAMRVDVLGIVGDAELAQHRKTLRGESLVQFDQIEIADLQSKLVHQLAGRRHRADAHDPRRHRGGRHAEDASAWRETVFLHRLLARQNNCRCAVVDARGVAGGHGAGLAHDRSELLQSLDSGIRPRMLVRCDDGR